MANVKLSAIAASPSNFAAGDQHVIVRGGTTDLLMSYAQIQAGLALLINTSPISGGTSGNFLYDNAGTVGERTPAATTAALALFSTTTTTQGVVPGSNNVGATFFLNATGAWAVPAGGTGAPGGSTLQVQYNNAGAFGGVNEYVESANVLAQRNGVNAQAHYVYNTFTDASNYERGVFDWSTTANVLTIGTQKLGTGSGRGVKFVSSSTAFDMDVSVPGYFTFNAVTSVYLQTHWLFFPATPALYQGSNCIAGWTSATDPNGSSLDIALSRVAANVLGIGTGAAASTSGWMQWAGQARVTSNFSGASSNIALADITGLLVNVQAGRTYAFYAYIACQTTTAAAGFRAGIGGTCTATNIVYDGYCLDTNTTKGQARAAALGGVVANSGTVTTVTGAIIEIQGEITVNAAGTLTVQIAQSVSTASSAPVVLQGSYLWVHDMP